MSLSFGDLFYLAIGFLSAFLQILLISAAIRQFRSFPVLACYAIISFLTSVMEGAIFLQAFRFDSQFEKEIYWIDEAILQLLVYLLVVSLMGKALPGRGVQQKRFRFDIALFALSVMAFCVLVPYKPGVDYLRWSTTAASRNLSFASAILNFLLWSVLLARQSRDRQLLILSGGLGVQTTGRAIGHSLRTIPLPGLMSLGNSLIVVTYVVSLFILWWALSKTQPAASFDRLPAKE